MPHGQRLVHQLLPRRRTRWPLQPRRFSPSLRSHVPSLILREPLFSFKMSLPNLLQMVNSVTQVSPTGLAAQDYRTQFTDQREAISDNIIFFVVVVVGSTNLILSTPCWLDLQRGPWVKITIVNHLRPCALEKKQNKKKLKNLTTPTLLSATCEGKKAVEGLNLSLSLSSSHPDLHRAICFSCVRTGATPSIRLGKDCSSVCAVCPVSAIVASGALATTVHPEPNG